MTMTPSKEPGHHVPFPESPPAHSISAEYGQQPVIPSSMGHFADHGRLSDTQLSAWTIEKPFNAESWEKAKPKQLRLSLRDLEDEVAKFRRKQVTIKDTLNTIKSETARNLPNQIVEEQNEKLWQHNPTIQWTIASVDVVKDVVKEWSGKQRRKLRRVDVFLKTEPRPMTEVHGGLGFAPLGHRQADHNRHGEQTFRALHDHGVPSMPAQHFPPPPPPPPPPQFPHDTHQRPPMTVVPPPPPGGTHHQPQIMHQPQARQVSGFDPHKQPFPGHQQHVLAKQPKQERQGKPEKHQKHHDQSIQIINVHEKKKKPKSKEKGTHHEHSDYSSDSSSDYSARSVEDGTYNLIERSRSRGRKHTNRPSHSRSRSHTRSQTRSRSRSRSRYNSRDRGHDHGIKMHKDRISKSRGRSGFDRPPMGNYYSSTSDVSPRSSAAALPPQNIVNIRIDKDHDRERDRERDRISDVGRELHHRDVRRSSHSISPTEFYNPSIKMLDRYTGRPMSRESSNGGSDTGSSFIDNNSSILSAGGGSVFSEPIRKHSHSHSHSHHRPRGITPAHLEFDRRGSTSRYHVDDYPRGGHDREMYYPSATKPSSSYAWHARPPTSSRRHSVQVEHPFASSHVASFPHPNSYADAGPRGGGGGRYTHMLPDPNPFAMHEFADSVPYVDQRRHRRGESRGSLAFDTDEWAHRPRYDTRGHQTHGSYRHG